MKMGAGLHVVIRLRGDKVVFSDRGEKKMLSRALIMDGYMFEERDDTRALKLASGWVRGAFSDCGEGEQSTVVLDGLEFGLGEVDEDLANSAKQTTGNVRLPR